MRGNERRVAITGIGALTPAGHAPAELARQLLAGESGVAPVAAYPAPPGFCPFAAEVRGFDVKKHKEFRKSAKVMARDIQLAVGAAKAAMESAGLGSGAGDPTRFGVNCGSGLIASEHSEHSEAAQASLVAGEFDIGQWGGAGLDALFPLWMLKYLPNMPACHISIAYDAQGPNNSITSGEASGLLAIGEAFRLVARGDADVFLAGGTDSKVHPLSATRQALLGTLTKRTTEPARAVRPFDADRDGYVPGEAAAFVVLEAVETAAARNAKPLADVLGFGAAWRREPGAAAGPALAAAAREAGVPLADLGVVFAHGAGLPIMDRHELQSLAAVLGPAVPIVGLKGFWGFLSSASGAAELVAALACHAAGEYPGTLNFARAEAGAPPAAIARTRFPAGPQPLAVVACSHSGQAAALIVRPAPKEAAR